MQSKTYLGTILRQFRLSEETIFLGHYAGITRIPNILSDPPHTWLPKANSSHMQHAASQGYTFGKENESVPNTKQKVYRMDNKCIRS